MSMFDDSSRNSQNTRKDGLLTSTTPIKVLVVDYKNDSLGQVVEVLHFHTFEVTCVDHPDAALRLLTQKNNQYDLLMIDRDMIGMDIHKFLKVANNMDLLSVVMSEQDDDAFMHEVFKSGAFLVTKRPLTKEALGLIRQDIIRRRMHMREKCKNKKLITKKTRQDIEIQKKRVHISSDGDDEYYNDNDDDAAAAYNGDTCMKKKIWVEWTKELHENFLNVLSQLDEGKWFPKKILELMGVPGLTRMQVASHLQKYRTDILKYNEKKTARVHGLPIDGWQTQNQMSSQTYSASSMMNISNQMNIAQGSEYTQIPFGCDLALNQVDKFGVRIISNDYFQQTQSLGPGQGSNDQELLFIQRQASEEFPNLFVKYVDSKGPNAE